MLTLFRNGGFPMFFILFFGATALATAFWFALRPSERHEGFIRWMGRATLYATFSGTLADLLAVMRYVVGHELEGDRRALVLCEGLGESLSPGIMGFSFLALVALMTAVGRRRLDARKP
jgi:hypothetical protein